MPDFNPDTGRRYAQSVRRPVRKASVAGKRLRTGLLVGVLGIFFAGAVLGWAVIARGFAPLSNTERRSFDAVIVLGTPSDSDGNPTPEMMDRIEEGVREYQRGIAPRIVVTGGAAHNQYVEARVMARVAQAQGVPESVIFVEPQAHDTLQNACYSTRILAAHGWHSAEVISNRAHLPRAAMIFQNLPAGSLEWRMHAAPGTLTSGVYNGAAELVETVKTARFLMWARWTESCTP